MGDEGRTSTAEAASRSRALLTLHLDPPPLADDWAVRLLPDDERDRLRGPAGRAELDADPVGFAISGVGVGALLAAEQAVLAAVAGGTTQVVILGAGFDTFALRHAGALPQVRVFEVDHPDVQHRKRRRLAEVGAPEPLPVFVPVDFEVTPLGEALAGAGFDPDHPAIVTWMNTLPYLSAAAIEATLGELSRIAAPGSELVCNYPAANVPVDAEQLAVLAAVRRNVAARGEPWASRYEPHDFVALLARHGYTVVEHLTEHDLDERFFRGRQDGFRAAVPARVVHARRATGATSTSEGG